MIYLDNAATTKIKTEVLDAMMPFLKEDYANPSAIYDFASDPASAIEHSRRVIAHEINANPEEIYFTSGGSESNSWVLSQDWFRKRGHLLTTELEHHSILAASKNYRTKYLQPDNFGTINTYELEDSLADSGYDLCSIQFANNEIGTVQDIARIGKICRENSVFFHTDAVQAFGHIPIDVSEMKIDFLSASGHKIGAPKGVGFLYIRSGLETLMSPLIYGTQENGLRGGTYNVPGIVGLGKAVELLNYKENNSKLMKLRNMMAEEIFKTIPGTWLNGSPLMRDRLPNNLNIRFEGIDSQQLIALLSQRDICVSAGSACNAGGAEPSHVLMSIGLSEDEAKSSIRFTLSEDTDANDVWDTVEALEECCNMLREFGGYHV